MKENYSSPRLSAEVADCSMPMTFDTYDNCSFECQYCFAQYSRAVGNGAQDYLRKEVNCVSVERIKKMFLDPDNHAGGFAQYIKQRRVMQWGGMSDQFDNFERKYGKTLELLHFFKEIDYPLCFSTKATWWTQDERYMELVRGQRNWNFKFSVITLESEKARRLEKGVPSPPERLAAIERIAKADAGGATLRLRPFVIGVSTPTYLELIREAASRGASALSTEFFCLDVRSNLLKRKMPLINELCGFDVADFYKKYSVGNGYLRLNRKVKEPFILNMQSACRETGMRFYVSDAHYKELCDNGSCCGLPCDWNYSHGQWTEALQIAKKNGVVYFKDVQPDIDALLSDEPCEVLNMGCSEKRARFKGLNMARYMQWLWNNPNAGQSPYKLFEGVLIPTERDEQGNLIYKYNGIKQ